MESFVISALAISGDDTNDNDISIAADVAAVVAFAEVPKSIDRRSMVLVIGDDDKVVGVVVVPVSLSSQSSSLTFSSCTTDERHVR